MEGFRPRSVSFKWMKRKMSRKKTKTRVSGGKTRSLADVSHAGSARAKVRFAFISKFRPQNRHFLPRWHPSSGLLDASIDVPACVCVSKRVKTFIGSPSLPSSPVEPEPAPRILYPRQTSFHRLEIGPPAENASPSFLPPPFLVVRRE